LSVDTVLQKYCALNRLRTSLCLQFEPHDIAAGAIFLAAKFLKVKLPSDGDKIWWQDFDVTPRQLEGWFFSKVSNKIFPSALLLNDLKHFYH
jgi:hypothetical protein